MADRVTAWEGFMNRRKLIGVVASAVAVAALPFSAAASTTYHGNSESKIFHSSGCRYFSCKACTKTFTSRQSAIDAGYAPCKTCKP